MITDVEMEAMHDLQDMCESEPLKEMVAIITDMLGELDSELFYLMSDKNKQAFLKPYAEKLNRYTTPERSAAVNRKDREESLSEDETDFTFADAKNDIFTYLAVQDETYFSMRNTTKEHVMNDAEMIEKLANEHYHCVTRFGCDRAWSYKDACDSDPGFFEKNAASLEGKIGTIESGKSGMKASVPPNKEIEKAAPER